MARVQNLNNPVGVAEDTTIDGASALPSIPAAADFCLIYVETQAIRYRDDGTDPTASVGCPLPVGSVLNYDGDLSAIKVISQIAGAKISVAYYQAANPNKAIEQG